MRCVSDGDAGLHGARSVARSLSLRYSRREELHLMSFNRVRTPPAIYGAKVTVMEVVVDVTAHFTRITNVRVLLNIVMYYSPAVLHR